MKEFHIIPNHAKDSHTLAPDCQCKPVRRNEKDAGGDHEPVWQHYDPDLPPPVMVGGIMDRRAWTLYVKNT